MVWGLVCGLIMWDFSGKGMVLYLTVELLIFKNDNIIQKRDDRLVFLYYNEDAHFIKKMTFMNDYVFV